MKPIPKIPYSVPDLVGFIFAPMGVFFLIVPIVMKVVVFDVFAARDSIENFLLFLPFLLIGATFSVIGGLLVMGRIRTVRKIKWLFTHGKNLQTIITGISQNPMVRVNGFFTWNVFSEYNGGARCFRFQSNDLIRYPNHLQEGDAVEVLVNPDDYNVYYMNLENPKFD